VLSVCENLLHTNEITALGIPSVDGYNSYFLQDYARLAERERGEPPNPGRSAFPRMGESRTIADRSVLDLLNVTDVIACQPDSVPGLTLRGRDEYFSLYRNEHARGRIVPACGTPNGASAFGIEECRDNVRIELLTADNPDGLVRARVMLPADQVLVFSEAYYPERQAWVDGAPVRIEKAAVALSAVRVPRGDHAVEFRFVPASLYYGGLISFAVCAGWFTLARRSPRSPW
jgi:hypothetical protein